MKLKVTYILLFLLWVGFVAHAQKRKLPQKTVKKQAATPVAKKQPANVVKAAAKDTVLKGATIEIIQSYKPEIKQAQKPESTPSLPPVDTATARVSMDVPEHKLNFTYYSLPLRPLVLAKDSSLHLYRNYLKAGAGNLSTILVDAGIAAMRGKDYTTTFRLQHLSQKGSIDLQKTSFTSLEANGILHSKKYDWEAGLNVYNENYYYYGFNDRIVSPASPGNKHTFTGVNAFVGMNNSFTDLKLTYHPLIRGGFFTDNYNVLETNISAVVPFIYNIDTGLRVRIGLAGAYMNLSRPATPTAYSNIAQLLAGVDYNKGVFSLMAALNPTIGQNNAYLLPDVRAAFTIPNTQLTIFAGWQGLLSQNRYEQLTRRNPYLAGQYLLQQTHTDEIFGGLQTNIGNHISFSGKVSWWQYENMPIMVNDTATDRKQFVIVYDKVNALSLQGSVRYQIADVMSAGVSVVYTNYTTSTATRRVWHEPGIRVMGDVMVKPIPKLLVTVNLSMMDELYAIDKANASVKMNSAFDLGAGAEYSFIPRLSVFANLNNIFNSQYERWYGYRVYGFNIFGGLRLKF